MISRWDNIAILQVIDRHQERAADGVDWSLDDRQLMDEVAGSPVTEDKFWRGFVQELDPGQ
jgi:hypothetical protein